MNISQLKRDASIKGWEIWGSLLISDRWLREHDVDPMDVEKVRVIVASEFEEEVIEGE